MTIKRDRLSLKIHLSGALVGRVEVPQYVIHLSAR